MAKWMIIVTKPFEELRGSSGGFLSELNMQLQRKNLQLAKHERPYVLYLTIADENKKDKGYISIEQKMREVYEVSQKLNFNYKFLYKGREYFDKIHNMDYYELLKAIRKEINFIKPTWLIIPYMPNTNLGNIFYEISDSNLVPNILFNQSYNNTDKNFYLPLYRDKLINTIDDMFDTYQLYKSELVAHPNVNSWEYNYYKMNLDGTSVGKEFAAGFILEKLSKQDDIFSINELEVEEILEEQEIKLEEII